MREGCGVTGLDPAILADERIVLGSLVRGTLRPSDAAEAPFVCDVHACMSDVLLALCPAPLLVLSRLCWLHARVGVAWAVRHDGGRTRRILIGYLPTLAREAPGRRQALGAVRRLGEAEENRRTAALARQRRADGIEARALQAALAAALDGDYAVALSALGRAERAIVGATPDVRGGSHVAG